MNNTKTLATSGSIQIMMIRSQGAQAQFNLSRLKKRRPNVLIKPIATKKSGNFITNEGISIEHLTAFLTATAFMSHIIFPITYRAR
jgi:hypothetical protein